MTGTNISVGRRQWILGATTSWSLAGAAAPRSSFSFFHFTETHISDQLGAARGCRQCFEMINRLGGDFAIAGGDLVYDVCAQSWRRAQQLYGLYRNAVKDLDMPVHHVLGNHDVCGLFRESGVSESDPFFGKRLFQEHIGRRYYSFAHKGWYFLALDSIGITRDRQYTGYVDAEQLEWLKRELAMIGKSAPIVVVTHMPLVTGYLAYGSLTKLLPPDALVVSNAREVLDILQPYNVKTVLQGHLHVREVVDNALGCRYITSGAVCGNWWRGPRDGHPEGFSRFSITGNTIRWQYYTYGFRSEEHISETPSIVMQPK